MISPFMWNHTYKALQLPTPCLLSFLKKLLFVSLAELGLSYSTWDLG